MGAGRRPCDELTSRRTEMGRGEGGGAGRKRGRARPPGGPGGRGIWKGRDMGCALHNGPPGGRPLPGAGRWGLALAGGGGRPGFRDFGFSGGRRGLAREMGARRATFLSPLWLCFSAALREILGATVGSVSCGRRAGGSGGFERGATWDVLCITGRPEVGPYRGQGDGGWRWRAGGGGRDFGISGFREAAGGWRARWGPEGQPSFRLCGSVSLRLCVRFWGRRWGLFLVGGGPGGRGNLKGAGEERALRGQQRRWTWSGMTT